jgi:hypothetical protein
MDALIQSNISEFMAAFARYERYTRKTPDAAMEQKAKNINIRVFDLFRDHEFGGYPRNKEIASEELKSRTGEHIGTRVRAKLLELYQNERQFTASSYSGKIAALIGVDVVKRSKLARKFGGALVKLWQSIVGREIGQRSAGTGFLAASFLAFKKRSAGEEGAVYVVNQAGGSIGYFLKTAELIEIASLAAGAVTVDQKYGIIAKAIADETAEFTAWMDAKDEANKQAAGI